RRVAFMGNIDNPFVLREMREFQAAAGTLALEAITSEIRRPQDIVPAFDALKHRANAIYLASEGLVDATRFRMNILAVGARPPPTWSQRELVEAGGVMSYGPSFLTNLGAAAILWTRFCAGRNRPTSRSSSRPSSSLSST